MADRKAEQQMAERNPGQRQDASRGGGKLEGAAGREIERAAREAEETARLSADQARQTAEVASDETRRMADQTASAFGAQTQQATELTQELIETQTEVMEMAFKTFGNATDLGTTSARIWASYSSAWVDMARRLMQFNADTSRRLQDTGGLLQTFEVQANLVREAMSEWSRNQSRIMETARRSANETGQQLQRGR